MIRGRVIPVTDGGPGLEARVDIGIAGSNSIFQTVASRSGYWVLRRPHAA